MKDLNYEEILLSMGFERSVSNRHTTVLSGMLGLPSAWLKKSDIEDGLTPNPWANRQRDIEIPQISLSIQPSF